MRVYVSKGITTAQLKDSPGKVSPKSNTETSVSSLRDRTCSKKSQKNKEKKNKVALSMLFAENAINGFFSFLSFQLVNQNKRIANCQMDKLSRIIILVVTFPMTKKRRNMNRVKCLIPIRVEIKQWTVRRDTCIKVNRDPPLSQR